MLSETSEALGDKTAENGELATHQSPRAALGRDEDSVVATEEPICDSVRERGAERRREL